MEIYLITNTVNGKKYVGQAVNGAKSRWKSHRYKAKNKFKTVFNHHLYNAIRKYGLERFNFEVLEKCSSLEELNKRESYWIGTLRCLEPDGYNATEGGGNGGKWSREAAMRAGQARKGRKHSKETIEEMRRIHKAIGSHNSLESRKKIGDALRGRKLSEEHRNKLSEAHLGIKPTQETLAKRSVSMTKRRVVVFGPNGELHCPWPNLSSWCKKYGLHASTFYQVAKFWAGKRSKDSNRSVKKHTCCYAEDFDKVRYRIEASRENAFQRDYTHYGNGPYVVINKEGIASTPIVPITVWEKEHGFVGGPMRRIAQSRRTGERGWKSRKGWTCYHHDDFEVVYYG